MFKIITAPVTSLMHRLSFQHKFILAGGLMILALGMALFPQLLRMNEDYHQLERRKAGVEMLAEGLDVTLAATAYRGLHLAVLRNLEEDKGELAASADNLTKRLLSLQAKISPASKEGMALTEAVNLWQEINRRTERRYSPVKAMADHGNLLFNLRQYLAETANSAALLQDSDPVARPLASLLAQSLPELTTTLSEASSLGIAAAAGATNDEERQRLAYLALHITNTTRAISESPSLHSAGVPALPLDRLDAELPAFGNYLINRAVLHFEPPPPMSELAQSMRMAQQVLADVGRDTTAALTENLANRHRQMEWAFSMQLGAISIVLIVATYVFLGFWQASRESIAALISHTERVINGDLSVEAKVRSRDELAHIADRFNQLANTLREIIGNIMGHSEQVSVMAGRLNESAAMVIQNSEVQTKAASSTSASVQQIAVGIASVNENVGDLELMARQGITKIESGELAVADLNERMRDVRNTMSRIADVSQRFVADAALVAEMTRRVRDISEQTNLLALNAAIEAARAGDQGRGFAVVADEVRKLAENVAVTAREIDVVMNGMRQQSGEVIGAIASGEDFLSRAEDRLEGVDSALQAMGSAVRATYNSVTDINRNIAEQKAASDDIARNMDGIARMSSCTHDAVGRVYELIRELSDLSGRMHGHVSHFQITS